MEVTSFTSKGQVQSRRSFGNVSASGRVAVLSSRWSAITLRCGSAVRLRAFRAAFRRNAFGWSGMCKAIERLNEAVAEIERMARGDPALAGEGAVLLLERPSPAVSGIDSSSGMLGNATTGVVEETVPVIAAGRSASSTAPARKVARAPLRRHPGRRSTLYRIPGRALGRPVCGSGIGVALGGPAPAARSTRHDRPHEWHLCLLPVRHAVLQCTGPRRPVR